MVYKNTSQLFPYSFGEQYGRDRRIHTAGQGAKHLAISYLRTQALNGRLNKRIHLPITSTATDFIDEIGKHFHTLGSMHDFRVELRRI